MDKKFSSSPIVLIMAGGALLGLIVSIFLIFTNPSRFPQGVATQISATPLPSETVSTQTTSSEGQQRTVVNAKQTLAKSLNLPLNATTLQSIAVVEAATLNWPDTSLGCAQGGRYYAQVLVPGYKVVLEAEGQRYEYHADSSEQVVLCPSANK